jgi:hypothetical protein
MAALLILVPIGAAMVVGFWATAGCPGQTRIVATVLPLIISVCGYFTLVLFSFCNVRGSLAASQMQQCQATSASGDWATGGVVGVAAGLWFAALLWRRSARIREMSMAFSAGVGILVPIVFCGYVVLRYSGGA